MRIVKLNAMDRGGAARAALRLQHGLRAIGVDARMIVQTRTESYPFVDGPQNAYANLASQLRLLLDQLPVIAGRGSNDDVFAPAWVPSGSWRRANIVNADIVHLHWITKAFLRVEELARLNAPIVWTMHDMWPFTGGCHYDLGCGRYRVECGECPVLGSTNSQDLSSRVFARKFNAWKNLDLTVVSPSRWLADCARSSALFRDVRIEVIPNGIDLSQFRPVEKTSARLKLGVGNDLPIILFGALGATENKRKGYQYLQSAIQILSEDGWNKKANLIIFGASGIDRQDVSGFPTRILGHMRSDDELTDLYSAADVFVAPSLQDNLPNTVMEALACGTPCVTFRIGGMPDMIDHKVNGYLAEPRDVEDLAHGIAWVLQNQFRREDLSAQARVSVENKYELNMVAQRYAGLYEDILLQTVHR